MSGLRNFGHGAAMDIADFKSESVPTSGGPVGLKPATQQVGNALLAAGHAQGIQEHSWSLSTRVKERDHGVKYHKVI